MRLAPLLSVDALEMYVTLEADEQQVCDIVQQALFKHFHVTTGTYRQRMKDIKRKNKNTWAMIA